MGELLKKRRNEIAWEYLVRWFIQTNNSLILKNCANEKGFTDEAYYTFFGVLKEKAKEKGYKDDSTYLYPKPTFSKEERNKIAWKLLVAIRVKEGINIIEKSTRRNVGNESRNINISTDEGMLFAHEVVKAVANKIFTD